MRARLALAMHGTEELLRRFGFDLFYPPLGGKLVWVRQPKYASSSEIWRLAAEAGIVIAPGKVFRNSMQDTPWLRLNVCHAKEPARSPCSSD